MGKPNRTSMGNALEMEVCSLEIHDCRRVIGRVTNLGHLYEWNFERQNPLVLTTTDSEVCHENHWIQKLQALWLPLSSNWPGEGFRSHRGSTPSHHPSHGWPWPSGVGIPHFKTHPFLVQTCSNRNGASKSTARVLRNVDILWQIPWGIAHMLDTVDGCEILHQLIDDSSHYL